MRLLLFGVILIFANIASCAEEIVTIWAPKKFYFERDYNIAVLSSDIESRTEISFQFHKSVSTVALQSDKLQNVRVANHGRTGSKKDFDLFMTLHRNETTASEQRQMCMTQTLQIEAEKRQFYAFIETDKPIYNPEDTVNYRIVVIDKDLKPYHMNNINVDIIDSSNQKIHNPNDFNYEYIGIIKGNFILSQNVSFGTWKFQVVVDMLHQYSTHKEFIVQERKSQPISAHLIQPNLKTRIDITHTQTFIPGFPYTIEVYVYDWKDSLVKSSQEFVRISYNIYFQNRSTHISSLDIQIKDGVAQKTLIVPSNVIEFTFSVQFMDIRKVVSVQNGAAAIGVNSLLVDHFPKNPKYGDQVQVYVHSDSEIDQLIATITSRHGIEERHQINCFFEQTCKFNISVSQNMKPEAKVMVYFIRTKSILKGETTIRSKNLGKNWLEIDLTPTAKPKQQIDIKFTTRPGSKVYLLAIDKRLSNFPNKNSITEDEVISNLSDFDASNMITEFNINKENWRYCTMLELKKIEKGRQNLANFNADNSEIKVVDEMNRQQNNRMKRNIFDTKLNENFHGVWLLDEFKVPSGNITKTYTTPDLPSSWMISAFAMNIQHGFTIGKTRTLIVDN